MPATDAQSIQDSSGKPGWAADDSGTSSESVGILLSGTPPASGISTVAPASGRQNGNYWDIESKRNPGVWLAVSGVS